MYVFQLFDYFSASGIILLTISFFESMVLGWIYGADRFSDNVEMMLGHPIASYFKISWKYLTPFMTLVNKFLLHTSIFLVFVSFLSTFNFEGFYRQWLYLVWYFSLNSNIMTLMCIQRGLCFADGVLQ